MSEQAVCGHCGCAGPADARYCARCGRALVPLRTRLVSLGGRLLGSPTLFQVGMLSLVCLVLLAVLVDRLIIAAGLYFPVSYIFLACVLGVGGAYSGWQWGRAESNGDRLKRVVLVCAGVGGFVLVVLVMDRALFSLLGGSGRRIAFDIPGMHIETLASKSIGAAGRRVRMVHDVFPYSLLTLVYVVLIGAASNLVHRVCRTR
jgi:hypothetical protein